ncbi:MAG TPA: intradiol ring-cleavage dioxygenase [Candidatus Limnocylindrales bacterium]|jgi:protocatechuate 3,4-dioxygenase beta subunit
MTTTQIHDPGAGPGRPVLIADDADEPFNLHDQGLQADVATLMDRRRVLQLLGLTGVAVTLAACAPGSSAAATASAVASAASSASTASSSTAAAACAPVIPEETAGPFPGDGTNGPDVLTESGVVRSDITTSFGASSGTAEGVPLTIRLLIQDENQACEPLADAAVYLWHCDREGRYSLYSQGVEDQNYLRGVQTAGADGMVTFTSIFPACYSGRWPHVHFEIYRSITAAADAGNKIATSQIALPKDICDQVYATSGYEQSVSNLGQISLTSDMVFGDDGGEHQIGTISGTVADGLTVELAVPVNA